MRVLPLLHRRLVALAASVLVASSVAAAPSPAGAAEATSAPAAVAPATPKGLPSGIEALARYVPANSCDPTAKPGVVRFGQLLKATYPTSSYGISRTCGTDPLPTSEHYDGRAVDWMTSVRVPAQKANAQAVLAWLFATDAAGNAYANARRLGVMYIIWNNRIWGSYRPGDGWRPYSSCAQHPEQSWDTTCHRDHVHVSFSWEGATGRTSFWGNQPSATDYGTCRTAGLNWAAPYSGPRTAPCPSYPKVVAPAGASALLRTLTTYSGMQLARGATGPVVKAVQQAIGTTADGSFGSATQAALAGWQGANKVPATGVVDAATWRALLAANTPKAPAATPTPPAPPATTNPAPNPATSPLTKYAGTVLRLGSRGPAVVALQKALRITADGWFGPQTRTAVNRFKSAHRLPVDGVVGRGMWKALGA